MISGECRQVFATNPRNNHATKSVPAMKIQYAPEQTRINSYETKKVRAVRIQEDAFLAPWMSVRSIAVGSGRHRQLRGTYPWKSECFSEIFKSIYQYLLLHQQLLQAAACAPKILVPKPYKNSRKKSARSEILELARERGTKSNMRSMSL